VGKGKRVDVYLQVRKRRGYIFLNETSACEYKPLLRHILQRPKSWLNKDRQENVDVLKVNGTSIIHPSTLCMNISKIIFNPKE
jgi:hypothetical protein